MTASTGVGSSAWCSSAPGVPATQCTGHGPPWSANEPWSGGCQSRVATTRSYSPDPARSLMRPAIASPSGTASAPPGQKSFWKSTMTSACFTRASIAQHGADPAERPQVVVMAHLDDLRGLLDRLLDRRLDDVLAALELLIGRPVVAGVEHAGIAVAAPSGAEAVGDEQDLDALIVE